MQAPCSVVVWYLLPAMGAELARELARLGLTQKEISVRLGITPAAVSQYVSGKRGREVKLSPRVLAEVKGLAQDLASGKTSGEVTPTVCRICGIARSEKALCKLHAARGASSSCGFCLGNDASCSV